MLLFAGFHIYRKLTKSLFQTLQKETTHPKVGERRRYRARGLPYHQMTRNLSSQKCYKKYPTCDVFYLWNLKKMDIWRKKGCFCKITWSSGWAWIAKLFAITNQETATITHRLKLDVDVSTSPYWTQNATSTKSVSTRSLHCFAKTQKTDWAFIFVF